MFPLSCQSKGYRSSRGRSQSHKGLSGAMSRRPRSQMTRLVLLNLEQQQQTVVSLRWHQDTAAKQTHTTFTFKEFKAFKQTPMLEPVSLVCLTNPIITTHQTFLSFYICLFSNASTSPGEKQIHAQYLEKRFLLFIKMAPRCFKSFLVISRHCDRDPWLFGISGY